KPLDNPLVKQALSIAIDRDVIIKELWRGRGIVPSGPIAKGDNHFDASLPALAYNPKEARELLKKAGYKNEEIVIETTAAYMAGDKPMAEAIQAMWKDAGVNAKVEIFEYSVRAQKNRDKSFKGLWWSDPTSTLRDPDGMMWRLLGPGGPQDYWRHAEWDELGTSARFSVDEKFRGEAYKKMTKIFLEHLPWIPVIQPYEDNGLQKYVEWTPDPLQQLEIRRFNFKLRRARARPLPPPPRPLCARSSASSPAAWGARSSRYGWSPPWCSSSCVSPAIRRRCFSRRTRPGARSPGCAPSSGWTGRCPCNTSSSSATCSAATSASPSASRDPRWPSSPSACPPPSSSASPPSPSR